MLHRADAACHIAAYVHALPQSISFYQPRVKSLYDVLELMSYKVVSDALRITTYQSSSIQCNTIIQCKIHSNHFMSYSLLTEGFKAFLFFIDDPSLQLNQILN